MHSDTGTVVAAGECAIVWPEDGPPGLLLPQMPDGERVPLRVRVLAAIFIRLSEDPDYAQGQIDWLDERSFD